MSRWLRLKAWCRGAGDGSRAGDPAPRGKTRERPVKAAGPRSTMLPPTDDGKVVEVQSVVLQARRAKEVLVGPRHATEDADPILDTGAVLACKELNVHGAWRKCGGRHRTHDFQWRLWVADGRGGCHAWEGPPWETLHGAAAEAAKILRLNPDDRLECCAARLAAKARYWKREADRQDREEGTPGACPACGAQQGRRRRKLDIRGLAQARYEVLAQEAHKSPRGPTQEEYRDEAARTREGRAEAESCRGSNGGSRPGRHGGDHGGGRGVELERRLDGAGLRRTLRQRAGGPGPGVRLRWTPK